VTVFLKRQCDRTLGAAEAANRGAGAGGAAAYNDIFSTVIPSPYSLLKMSRFVQVAEEKVRAATETHDHNRCARRRRLALL
jgi:hypothetical protein